MDSGRVLHACSDGVHVLRFLGDIRYTLSPSLEDYVHNLFSGSTPAAMVIDLVETESIDSTNLGLMARMAMRMEELGGSRITIVSDRPEINVLLNSMAFDEVFDIVPRTAIEAAEATEIAVEPADKAGTARTVLNAHRALMELSEHNRDLFRDVVTEIEKNESR